MGFWIFILSFLITATEIEAQTVIEDIKSSNLFCSSRFLLYSDSTFVFERGCEEKSTITLGDYKIENDTIFLFPKKLSEINLIANVEQRNSGRSKPLKTIYKSISGDMVDANTKYVTRNTANLWIEGQISSEELINVDCVIYNPKNFRYSNSCKNEILSCPIELALLSGTCKSFPISPKNNQLTITLNLPSHALVYMINYEVQYSDFEHELYQVENRILKVQL